MRSLKFKILVTVGILLTVSNIFLGVYFFSKASVALENQIMISLQQSVHATAEAVEAMNAKELKTLHTLAANPVIRDPSISLLDKTHVVYGTMSTDKDYVDVAILDEEGFAWINNGAKRIPFSEREYFKVPKNTGNDFVTDPFINKVDNTMAIFYSVPVFDEKNKVINVVFAVADGFKPSNLVEKHPAGNGRIPKIISMKSNLTIASEDHSLVASENLLEQTGSQADGKKYNAVIRDALSGRPKASMYTYQGKEFMEASEKVPGVDWIVTNSVPESDFKADLQKLKFMVVGIIIVLTIIAIIGVAVVIDKVINPLRDLNRAIGEIASGNADLTKRITIHSKDEIGEVVEGFNKFEEKLQNIVTEIKSSKDVLSVVGSDIGDNMQTTGVVIQGMFNDIHNTQDEINVQSQSVNHTVNAITRVSESIESLDEMIENQTHGIAQASAAVEQMMGNINAVNSSVEKMADSFDTLQSQSSSGVTKQKLVSEQIKGIEEQSKILQEANVVISSIANQTNLLAMNAAIEAAHAGEAGKGFSVVADEIRKLSETSTAQSKKISEQLKHIMLSISNVVQASTESSESFNTVTNLISNTDEVVRQIKAAMEEQNVGSKQINDALHDMNDSAGEVRDASRLMAEGNKQILDSVQALQSATSSMSQRMEVLTDRAQQINDSGLELNELADRISSSINEISSQIDQFKV